ncbi:MAG: hypothetical protein HYX33_02900 [Actinobacteria bacterium]|nr:hypothetical protein [Actinomycetota bacterium]
MRVFHRKLCLVLAALAVLSLPGLAAADQSDSQARSLQAGWISAGFAQSCAVPAGGGPVCWGSDGSGQLGNGAVTGDQVSPSPVALPAGRRAAAISAGVFHSCAVLDDGSAVCWGSDTFGQLGNGDVTGDQAAPSPVVLPAGRRATAISAGANHSCAVLDDGSAVCWGSDTFGQLGNGALTGNQVSPSPVTLPAGRRATAISAGLSHSCAVLDDGSAVCWGSDSNGQLGNGAGVSGNQASPSPVVLPVGRRATAISVGDLHTCAVLDDGSAVCWGNDVRGQLGDGAGVTGDQVSPSPVVLPAGRRATAISAGANDSCAVLDDGSAVCWGDDTNEQLGNGAGVVGDQASPSPVLLPTGHRATAIGTGDSHSCAVLDDGSVVCWGDDTNGQLGNGAAVTVAQADPSLAPLALSAGAIPPLVADLSVSTESVPATLTVGQTAQLVVRVTNTGPDPATGVTVTLTATRLNITGTVPGQGAANTQTWQPGPINPAGRATLVVKVTGVAPGSATLTAEVTAATEPDPDSTPANRAATEDDQTTAAITILAAAAKRKLRPRGLTLNVRRDQRRLTLTGTLTLPPGQTCRGAVTTAARIGKRLITSRVRLRANGKRCGYRARLTLPAGKARGVRVTAKFTGNTSLLPITSRPKVG